MPSLSLNIGLNNGRKLPFGGGGGAGFGLPNSIIISGAVGGSINANGTYSKTDQPIGYLDGSANGSYNYYNYTIPQPYITSPNNQNTNGDYSYNGWVIAYGADSAVYLMINPSTDKFNFPTTGWLYGSPQGGANTFGQSGSASLTITAA